MHKKNRNTIKKRNYKRTIKKGGEPEKAEIQRIVTSILGSGYEQISDCNAYLCYKYIGKQIKPVSRGFFSSTKKVAPVTTIDMVSELNNALNKYNLKAEIYLVGGTGYVIQIIQTKV